MKKKCSRVSVSNALKKPFLIMKLTFVLIVFSVFQSFAGIGGKTESIDNNLIAIPSREASVSDVTVNGRVTGSSGESLSGVSVSVKGKSGGTSTNANGEYNLTVPDNAVLVFSFVGFTNQEISVAGKPSINISL